MLSRFHLQSQETKGVVFGFLAMFLYSTYDGITKFILGQIDFMLAIFIGCAISCLFVVVFTRVRQLLLKPKKFRNVFFYSIFVLLEQFCFLFALKHIPIAELFVIILAAPILVLVLSALILHEHLRKEQIIAIFSGFLGALIVILSPVLLQSDLHIANTPIAPSAPAIAWICAIGNIFFHAGKVMYLRKFCQDENNFALSFGESFLMMLACGCFIIGHTIYAPLWILGFLILASAIAKLGSFSYIKAYQFTKAPLVAATQYSQIVWAFLMGIFIFHESPTFAGVVGSLLILLSGYFLYFRKTKAAI